MPVLDLFPSRVRFCDANGMLTPEANRAMKMLFTRVGGAVAPSIPELEQATEDLDMGPAAIYLETPDPLHPLPQHHVEVQHLLTELNELREQVTVLLGKINDMEQGSNYGRIG